MKKIKWFIGSLVISLLVVCSSVIAQVTITGTLKVTSTANMPGNTPAVMSGTVTGIVGQPGATGEKGDKGDIGPMGATGITGQNGINGINGLAGAPGPMGPTGPSGTVGPTGATPFITTGGNIYYNGGNLGIGTSSPTSPIDINGQGAMNCLKIRGGCDLSERAIVSPGTDVRAGLILVIDPLNPNMLKLPDGAYDRKVAGVISGANNYPQGIILSNSDNTNGVPIALVGNVYVWCESVTAPINVGDMITTSGLFKGMGMKAKDMSKSYGAIIGKAMENLPGKKTGYIKVKICLQ
jgi:hypothetical protein